jgi:hypothetical protein
MNKTLKQIQKDFDVKGIFPSDAELHFALIMISRYETNVGDIRQAAWNWELDMISKAEKDVLHPYHHMVTPMPNIYNINCN